LDRLIEPRPTGVRAIPRQLPAEDAGAFVRSSIENLPQRYRVEVLIHATAATVRERIGPWGALEDLGPGLCRLQMSSDSLDWPTLALGRAAAEFEVSSPAELVDYLRECADLFGRAIDRHRRS
jgi:predicted DNA-binding transcriptional regulator YafY